MKSFLGGIAVAAGLIAGCGGSSLSACPDHQPCVRYVANPGVGGNGATDGAATDPPNDMAHSPALDLTVKPADQAMPAGDLSMSPADLAPACLPTGGACPNHDDAICCSHYCVYATNSCR
jgi:hypothetical protein